MPSAGDRPIGSASHGSNRRTRSVGWLAFGVVATALAALLCLRTGEPTAPALPVAEDTSTATAARVDAAVASREDDAQAASVSREVAPSPRWRAPQIAFVHHDTGLPAANLAIRFVPLEGNLDRTEDAYDLLALLATAQEGRIWRTDGHGMVTPDPWPGERCLAVCTEDHVYVVDGDTIAAADDEPNPASHRVTVARGYAIRGTVRSAKGEPIAGARVFAGVGKFASLLGERVSGSPHPLSPAAWRIDVTDATGGFVLRGIPVEVQTTITASAPGHAVGELGPAPRGGAGETVFASVSCRAATSLAVRVLGEGSLRPIADAAVTVWPEGKHETRSWPTTTDRDGRATVADLAIGPNTLEVRADGFATQRQPVNLAAGGSELEVRLLPRPRKRPRARPGR